MYCFHVPNMSCGGCLGAVTRAVQKADPTARVDGDLKVRQITVASDKAEAVLLATLREAGYPAQTVRPTAAG